MVACNRGEAGKVGRGQIMEGQAVPRSQWGVEREASEELETDQCRGWALAWKLLPLTRQ